MKLKPCLILTSVSALLCQVQIIDAQQPQPRFGYGSVPGGAYVIPAPKTAPRPVAKPAAKPTGTTAAKPKVAVKAVAKAPDKSGTAASKASASKTTMAKTGSKTAPASKTPAPKAVAATASKTKTNPAPKTPVKAAAKPEIAKTAPRAAAKSATPKPESGRLASRPSPSRNPVSQTSPAAASREVVRTAPIVPNSTSTSSGPPARRGQSLVADITPAPSSGGFHFFGAPIVLPEVPASLGAASSRNHFVEVMAARHARRQAAPLGGSEGASRETGNTADGTAQPAVGHLAATAPASPALANEKTAAPPLEATISEDDLNIARSVPASLALSAVAPQSIEPSLETTPLDEPALPAPVVAQVPPASPPAVTEESLEPELPRATPPPASGPDASIATIDGASGGKSDEPAGEHDLSERERAFVRSLAEAAGTVTSSSSSLNQDLPRSIATAASAVMNQIPAETVTSFQSAARTARDSVRKTIQDAVPDLPMEISNDLMPSTPEKMPEQLPAFNAAPSGKIDVQSDRQADYDQANNKVIFTGKVELNSAAIRLRAERVEVFMKKGGGGMDRVEASGNVLMRTQDTENGPGQMASAGHASYNLKTGEITLSDWPKIQETSKSHISTAPSTKMYLFTDGRLRTDGPNRTLIGGAE